MSGKIKVPNTADRAQVEEQRKLESKIQFDLMSDMKHVLSTGEGRRLIYTLVNQFCRYDTDSFNHSGSLTNYNLGQREIGRIIKSIACEADVEKFQLMERENWAFLKEALEGTVKEPKENSDE